MPIRLSNIVNRSKETTVSWDGENLRVSYRPYTPAMEMELQAALAEGGAAQSMSLVRLLAKLLVDWDVQDDRGKRIEPEEKVLATLPISLLVTIGNAIVEDMRPPEVTAETSGGGS